MSKRIDVKRLLLNKMEKLWKKTFILNKNTLFGTTFILRDGSGHAVSIDLTNGTGYLPAADKNIFFVLGIPLKMECSWKFIPGTERSMSKIYFEEVRE